MMRTQLHGIQDAREDYWSSDNESAFRNYVDSFDANTKAWWLAMEAIRCKRILNSDVQTKDVILYSPYYARNSYQRNLYSECTQFNYEVLSVSSLTINEMLIETTCSHRMVYHQHWLKDIYWNTFSMEEGIKSIDRHIGIIKALKSYGAKICWTLHNLIDHDATPMQEELNCYVLREMAEVSDHIFMHTHGAGDLLSEHCGIDIQRKFKHLEHPLYDDLLSSSRKSLPEEIKFKEISGKRILLSVGMIRPYKGVPNLIRAFQKVVQGNGDHGCHLIIAGQFYDPEVSEVLDGLDVHVRKCISLVARRLSDDELASLMQLADVSVTSYKKILTSGSYYLATTFGKPTVAPRKGMFAEIIKDEETGFLYDGSVGELSKLLTHISRLSQEDLVRVGDNAFKSCNHLTISATSKRFFSILEAEE